MNYTHNQRGFTLIEIGIVVIIIGLLIGGVLKGTSLVRAMHVKDVISIAKDLSTASQYFKDRYHYLPGDWPYTANEIPNVTEGGDGNGLVDSITSHESVNVPNHLFNAGFIKGGAGQITSTWGNVRVVANTAPAGSVVKAGPNPVPATALNLIEFDNLPCDVALEIDQKLDDGNLATGSVRASVASCTPKSTSVPLGVNDPVPSLAVPL